MTDEIKLTIDTLRYCEESGARCGECPSGVDEKGIPRCHSQAHIADLIESLAAELEQVKQERDGLSIMLAQAQSMLETRTRERDAAIAIIAGTPSCETCAHYTPGYFCPGCRNKSNWQFCGVKR